ncbi:hypothetical protein ACVWYH_000025 [Bradyrhizobium sp. GM24.11]
MRIYVDQDSHPNAFMVDETSVRDTEGLIEIRDDVIDVLDSHAQPDHLGPHPGFVLFFG